MALFRRRTRDEPPRPEGAAAPVEDAAASPQRVSSGLSQAMAALPDYRSRVDVDRVQLMLAPMGRLSPRHLLHDGSEANAHHHFFALSPVSRPLELSLDAAYEDLGAPWTVGCVRDVGGVVSGWVDFDLRPPVWVGLWGELEADMLLGELVVRPRRPELVPGWMKVELAVAGLWDVDVDGPGWDEGLVPRAVPVSREFFSALWAWRS